MDGFEHRFATVVDVQLNYMTGGKPDGDTALVLADLPETEVFGTGPCPRSAAGIVVYRRSGLRRTILEADFNEGRGNHTSLSI